MAGYFDSTLELINNYKDLIDLGEKIEIQNVLTKEDKEKYFIQNINLLIKFLLKKYNFSLEIDDYFQECSISFLNSIDKYNSSVGTEFSSYVYSSFINTIKTYRYRNTFTLKADVNFMGRARRVKKLLELNYDDNYIMKEMKINETMLYEYKRFLSLNENINLDYEIGEGNEKTSLSDLVTVPEDFIEKTLDRMTSDEIYNLVFNSRILKEKEKRVIYLRFYQNMTLQQIGNEFGVSREWIRKIEEKSLKKLREGSAGNLLREYYFYK